MRAQSFDKVKSWVTGLPDVIFQNQNTNLGKLCRLHISMEDVGMFYGHLVYLTAI
jgi:hypothetical protein